jgi:hypothetical protein
VEPNWQLFYRTISQKQWLFVLTKCGWKFNKGFYKGALLSEFAKHYRSELLNLLKNTYEHEESSSHTKKVIIEIMEDIFDYKKSTGRKK